MTAEIEKLIADLTRMAATIRDNASREERPLKRKLMEAKARTVDDAATALRAMQAETERLRGERDELRAAIFGSPDYAADLRNGNFREMAETLHAARAGGVARAEAAEAKLAEVTGKYQHASAMADAFCAKQEAAEATVATLTAQVKAMRGALEQIAGSDIQSFMIDARVGPHTVSHNRRYCDAPDVARLLKIARAALEPAEAGGVEAKNTAATHYRNGGASALSPADVVTPRQGAAAAAVAPTPDAVEALVKAAHFADYFLRRDDNGKDTDLVYVPLGTLRRLRAARAALSTKKTNG